jgi:cobalamin biosynthesis Mg chelatase CobN
MLHPVPERYEIFDLNPYQHAMLLETPVQTPTYYHTDGYLWDKAKEHLGRLRHGIGHIKDKIVEGYHHIKAGHATGQVIARVREREKHMEKLIRKEEKNTKEMRKEMNQLHDDLVGVNEPNSRSRSKSKPDSGSSSASSSGSSSASSSGSSSDSDSGSSSDSDSGSSSGSRSGSSSGSSSDSESDDDDSGRKRD